MNCNLLRRISSARFMMRLMQDKPKLYIAVQSSFLLIQSNKYNCKNLDSYHLAQPGIYILIVIIASKN